MVRAARGFTLIELMIGVTVIGILILIALPAFQNYSLRSKVSEAFTLSAPVRTRIADLHQEGGELPANNAAAALEEPAELGGKYVSTITVLPGGVIQVAFDDPALGGHTVSFTAAISGPTLTWQCSSTLPRSVLPGSCR